MKQVDLVERNALRARWQPIDQVIKRETLKWIRHIARMGRDRLPKIAIFGWRNLGGRIRPSKMDKSVLKEAKIPEMDWFRAAQSDGPEDNGCGS